MIYKDTIPSLIKSGIISKAPVDYTSIDSLMKRAGKYLMKCLLLLNRVKLME